MLIPRELIRDARAGSVKCLHQLSDDLNHSNYTLAALDAALAHRSVDILPKGENSMHLLRLMLVRARKALTILALSTECCKRSESVKKATIHQILEETDGILAWIHLFVQYRPIQTLGIDSITLQRVLVELLERLCALDPLLKLCIFSSSRAFDLLLFMWSKVYEDHAEGQDIFVVVEVLNFMETFLDDPEGSDLVCNSLRSSPSVADRLYHGLEARLEDIERMYKKGEAAEEMNAYLALIGLITIQLTQQPAMDVYFRDLEYLRKWLDVVCSPKLSLGHEDLLLMAHCLFLFADRRRGRPAVDVGEIARSGLIPLLAKYFTAKVPEWTDEIASITYSHFPKVLIPLNSALDKYHQGHPLQECAPSGANGQVFRKWQELVTAVRILKLSSALARCDEVPGHLPDRIPPRVCDNESHGELWKDDEGRDWTSDTCSNCHSTRYCGVECQREDWNRHRQHCEDMRRVYDRRRSVGIHYSTYTQHVHQGMVRVLLHNMLSKLDVERRDKWPGAPITDFVLTFNGSSRGDTADFFEVVPWDEWGLLKGDCPAAELEVTKIIDRWRATSEPTTRLVEAIFQYRAKTHVTLFMEIKVPDGPVIRSIVMIE
ncbi:hypothetical protein BKA70DRAFT_1306836 [Coprinopsis sp. MPI-PUGE-AT-0042]|nr:hypothetical protein BKA70DRAFT_1306836 [Coprinopsis sp. MPI-PUGE-AT-0042]